MPLFTWQHDNVLACAPLKRPQESAEPQCVHQCCSVYVSSFLQSDGATASPGAPRLGECNIEDVALPAERQLRSLRLEGCNPGHLALTYLQCV